MSAIRVFYESGLGDRLIDAERYPAAIIEFLLEEQKLVNAIGACMDALVEVGCMHGRFLEWAIRLKKRYLGIDVASTYIEVGRKTVAKWKLSSEAYEFIVGDAGCLPDLLKERGVGSREKRALLLFPFNSFGNMEQPERVIDGLVQCETSFLISSYMTTEEAINCRREYYTRCGYADLRVYHDEKGVAFSSSEGFCSVAYHPNYLRQMFDERGILTAAVPFSTVGVAYMTLGLFRSLSPKNSDRSGSWRPRRLVKR